MGMDLGEVEEDLGGSGDPLSERVSYPPNLPDLPRTSPKSTRPYMAKICFALYGAGALEGSFCLEQEVRTLYMVRLRTRSVGEKRSAIMPCASAGRRDLGTRVRYHV